MTPPFSGRGARAAHGILAAIATFAVVSQLVLTVRDAAASGASMITEIVRLFSYFTILTNALVALSEAAAAHRTRLGGVQRVLRINAVTGIIVTGVVYWTMLRGPDAPTGFPGLVDLLLHGAVPILAPVLWLLLGPRGQISVRDVAWSFVFPVVYAAWTFGHGASTAWYPYGFIDVAPVGWGGALTMAAVIFAVVGLLAGAMWGLDVLLRRVHTGPGADAHRAGLPTSHGSHRA